MEKKLLKSNSENESENVEFVEKETSIKAKYYYKSKIKFIAFIFFLVINIFIFFSLTNLYNLIYNSFSMYLLSFTISLLALVISLSSIIINKSIFTKATYRVFYLLGICLIIISCFNNPLSGGYHILKIGIYFSMNGYILLYSLLIFLLAKFTRAGYEMQEELDQVI